MPTPWAAQPPWRRLVIVSIVLPAVITLAVLAFAWPAARVRPRDLPVGVVGPGSQQAIEHSSSAQPGAFDVHVYPDEATARSAIGNRHIYGAFVVDQHHVQILEASAASPTVAQLLTSVGATLAAGTSSTHSSTDVVPLSQADPRGIVFGSVLLPVTISGMAIAVMIGLVARFRPAWRQIGALLVVSMAAGASVYLIVQSFLGALPHQGLADWAALSLTVLAIGATAAGLLALVGVAGLGIAAALMVFVGNPFSGVTSAPELLPDAIKHLGQALPPGAGANLLRSTAYFDGQGAAGHLAVLITWTVLGFAAVVIGQHTPHPIRRPLRPTLRAYPVPPGRPSAWRAGGRESNGAAPGLHTARPVMLASRCLRRHGGEQGLVVGVDGTHDASADLAQLPGLGFGQRVEDQAADFLDMAGRGLGHFRQALAGQYRQGVAAVCRIGGAAHPATLLHPGDDLGQARQRALGQRRQCAHPQRAAGRLRQVGQHLVLEMADRGVAAQLRIERSRQPDQRAGQGAPRLAFLGVEPTGLVRGVH
jgi:hypothetical protein